MDIVTFIFTGLLYIFNAGDHVEVIAMRLEEPIAPFHTVIPPHVAYVKIPVADIKGGVDAYTRKPDFIVTLGKASPAAVYVARGEEIVMRGGNLDTAAIEVCKTGNGKCTFSAKKLQYEKHVIQKSVVCKDCSQLDSLYRQRNVKAVAMRLDLTKGRLYADGDGLSDDEWTFQPIKMKHKQDFPKMKPVAQRLRFEVDIKRDAKQFEIVFAPFRDSTATPDVLNIALTTTEGIEIGHLPAADLLRIQSNHEMETEDHHFAAYYLMLERPVSGDPPLPHREPKPHALGAPSGSNCPPFGDEKP